MRLIFMGTPLFALPTLRALHEAGYGIAAVYTQPPRPAGRGQKDTPSPVHAYAEAHGLPARTPASLKSPEAQAEFAAWNADAAVVAAYGLLLPKAILQAPKHGCLNVHPSLLPRWRGAAPVQRALMAGDTLTGVCIMQMDEGLDTGGVHMREEFPIPPGMDAGALHDALAALGASLMLRTLQALQEGKSAPHPQAQEGVTYAAKITKADGRIDWSRSAVEIHHQIRALSPAPGAYFQCGEESIKVFLASPATASSAHPPGTVLDNALTVACGQNTALRLLEVQRPGKKRMPAVGMLQGFNIPHGSILPYSASNL